MKTVLLHDQPLSDNGNHRTGAKRFGRGRIAGLILIALLTLGLGYLHFAGGSTPVSVPSGAHAGQLTLKHCTYGNEAARLRHARRPREPAQPALAPHRTADHSHPRTHLQPRRRRFSGSRAAPALSNMDFPDASASPPATTSCSSATAASTAPHASTAPR